MSEKPDYVDSIKAVDNRTSKTVIEGFVLHTKVENDGETLKYLLSDGFTIYLHFVKPKIEGVQS